jgi:cell surface protein SprA
VNWKLGSTPLLFPDATAPRDSLQYSYRRAKIAWYTVDNTFNTRSGRPGGLTDQDLQNHFVRQVLPQEIFPARDRQQVNLNENLMNIAYYPAERGMYNYNPSVTAQGRLPNDPRQNWAALTRAIRSDIDFDNANVQYIEFWMMDPFMRGQTPSDRTLIQQAIPGVSPAIYAQDNQGGDLYFNLGNISEDVLKDERHAFENGLPVNDDPNTQAAATNWGQVPGTQFLTNAFENTTGARGRQDVGLDGLTNEQERAKYGTTFEDPSGDDFAYFLDNQFESGNTKLLDRYKNFNGMEGNSPEAGGSDIARSATTYPDNEDLNQDNTVSNLESYYQYKISLRPDQMAVGRNYIVAKRDTNIGPDRITWYQFRIPVREYTEKVGNIENFKSIRFMRMFLTNWQQPVVLRLAQYQLVANQWRTYGFSLEETKLQQPVEPTASGFTLGTVNIEENSGASNPVPYQIPPGFIRDRDITTINNRLLNEQSLRMCVDELRDGDARAAFKTTVLDFINYKRIRMFLHAETGERYPTANNEVTGFLRLGTDYTENYYEIEKTLVITPDRSSGGGRLTAEQVWPEANEIDFPFSELVRVKSKRNADGVSVLVPYEQTVEVVHSNNSRSLYRVRVVGNPDLSSVQIIMLGVRNPTTPGAAQPKSVCIWANELRVTDFDQESGWAATGRLNIKLADFATVSASARHTTYGFGGIQDRISERARENTTRWDATANINLDKLLPAQFGLKVPLFVGYERERIRPRFNPLDPDVELEQSIDSRFGNRTVGEEREYRKIVEDNTTRRSLNFSNIQKVRQNPDAKPHLWDIENWSLSYAYSDIVTTNVTTAQYLQKNQRGGLAYAFTTQPKFIEPFKNLKFLDNPWTKWLQEFNFALTPSSVGVRGDLDRSFTRTQYRNSDLTTRGIAPLYEKFFTFNRLYDLRWNLARNLSLDYTATANAVIDEPRGDIDDSEINPLTDSLLLGSGYTKRDSVLANIKRLGRMKQFQQRAALTYRLPFDKFVLTDWLNADVRYGAGYQWTACPRGRNRHAGPLVRQHCPEQPGTGRKRADQPDAPLQQGEVPQGDQRSQAAGGARIGLYPAAGPRTAPHCRAGHGPQEARV